MPGVEGDSRRDEVRKFTGCQVVSVLRAPCSTTATALTQQEEPLLWAPGFRVSFFGFPLPLPHPTSKESRGLRGMLLPSMCSPC